MDLILSKRSASKDFCTQRIHKCVDSSISQTLLTKNAVIAMTSVRTGPASL